MSHRAHFAPAALAPCCADEARAELPHLGGQWHSGFIFLQFTPTQRAKESPRAAFTMYRTTLPVTLTQPCSDKWCHTNCAEKSCGTLQAQLLSSSQVPGVPRLAQMSSQTVLLPSSSTCCCSFSPRLFPFVLSKGRWIHLLCTSEKEKGKLK